MRKKREKNIFSRNIVWYFAAFLLTLLILMISMAIDGMFPFGDNSVLKWDLEIQYIDIYAWFRNALHSGEGLFYSFSKSLGGNMFGVLEYSLAASKEGIQPIIGSELLMEASKFFDKAETIQERENNFSKIVLLAQTDEGYYNLVNLASENFLQRQPGITPHIDFEWLKKKGEGIICLTGGCEGLIGKLLLRNQKTTA